MQAVSFIVQGVPISKPRPRVTTRVTYMPDHYVEWREHVGTIGRVALARLARQGKPWNAAAAAYAIGCRFFIDRANRGDIDGLLGSVMDAMNKLAWPDDRRVAEVFQLTKEIDKARPRVEVEIRVLEARAT